MKKIKNISSSTRPLKVPGIGLVEPGGIIEVPDEMAESLTGSPNFEMASDTTTKKSTKRRTD